MKILVLEGGDSSERAVSLRSAESVVRGLEASRYSVTRYDTKDGLDKLALLAKEADVVFPVLHGVGGEDGAVQTLLEEVDARYLGATASVSRHCFDKYQTKITVQANGMVTPKAELVDEATYKQSVLTQKPYVLKPNQGGSSIDTFLVRDPSKIDDNVAREITTALEQYPKMLIEELIDGQEITVSILGEVALPVIEIVPPANEEFDYENKYNGKTQELCPPQNVSEAIQKEAQNLAIKVQKILGVRHLSRVDMMLRGDQLYILEINTMPGLTDQSLFPKSARVAGLDMAQLSHKLLVLANTSVA